MISPKLTQFQELRFRLVVFLQCRQAVQEGELNGVEP
jgi:hypothetical protein